MKKFTLIIIVLIILVGIIFFFYSIQETKITGKVIPESDSYTKAICDETNYCQDYVITCDGKTILTIKSLTGATVQHPDDWTDPRNNSDTLCSRIM